jgi:predicted transcriptional regulator
MPELSARRSKFQLSVEVLECIRQGEEKPTRIMYNCNLSWKSLKEILENLCQQDLLEESVIPGKKRSKRKYIITVKGENVLKYYRAVSGLIEVEGLSD